MENELGLFPLNLVAFPGEHLKLHIFEPRYKQLINDCLESNTTFGIPSYVFNKTEYGTEVKIDEVTKTYKDGRIDIKIIGISTIKVLEFQNPWNDKLYAGGLIKRQPYDDREDKELKTRLIDLVHELFLWLKIEEKITVNRSTSLHEIIHKIGLKPEEEYEILKMQLEKERQRYVISHLKNIIPVLERAEKAKERVLMNGHFKHLDILKF